MKKLTLTAVTAILLALLVAPAAFAQGGGGGGGGGVKNKRGKAKVWQGTCKYRVFARTGVLQVGTAPPRVSGANTRRRTRRERTYVRYRVSVADAYSGSTYATSSWSSWLKVRQSGRRTWSGATVFNMEWQGNYGAVVRVEWWNAKRRIGWRDYRTPSFLFYNQYNTGPFGPISSCYRYTG